MFAVGEKIPLPTHLLLPLHLLNLQRLQLQYLQQPQHLDLHQLSSKISLHLIFTIPIPFLSKVPTLMVLLAIARTHQRTPNVKVVHQPSMVYPVPLLPDTLT